MEEDRQTVIDSLLSNALVERDGNSRLYCLGPNVGRINFLSQQYRALNLVWAMRQSKTIKPNYKVAVVGAGIAGVTAAIALRANKCAVHVFDIGGRPLHRQFNVTHRHIFPNINWWPYPDAELALTTALPYLNWHLGQCDDVIRMLDAGWNELHADSPEDLKFHRNTMITAAGPDASKEGKLVLTTDDNEQYKHYDVVIVASGFGQERPLTDEAEKPIADTKTKSYWLSDNLEAVRDSGESGLPMVVFGFGDGGQIEALRIAYDFSFGKLSFQVAEAISAAESDDNGQATAKKRVLSKKIEGVEKDLSNKYQDYEKIVRWLAKSTKNPSQYYEVMHLLEKNLHDIHNAVIMTDKNLVSPYQSGAAPIHKFMIAYASYRSTVTPLKTRATLTPVPGQPGKYKLGDRELEKGRNHFVVRVGAGHLESSLLTPAEWERLEIKQRNAARYSYKPAWPEKQPPPVPRIWPCPTRKPEAYVDRLQKSAQDAMHFAGSSGSVSARDSSFVVVGHDRDFKPTKLFGKPVVYVSTPVRAFGRGLS